MSQPDSDPEVAAVRAFNRFYTRKLGVLDQQLVKSPFSLSEARVLYELAHREELSAKEISAELGLDAGYLSRIVQNFDEAGLITREPLPSDRRQYRLALTAKGRQSFAKLDRSTDDDIAAMLANCRSRPARLIGAMADIERLLGETDAAPRPRRCASPAPATWDGWCRAMARFTPANTASIPHSRGSSPRSRRNFSPRSTPRGNVAGSPRSRETQVGSIFLVRHTDDVAKLRLLLVDPAGRGQGLGHRLVGECIAFAKARGYRKITLWTQSILVAARKIYQEAGFKLVATEPHRSFGQT